MKAAVGPEKKGALYIIFCPAVFLDLK